MTGIPWRIAAAFIHAEIGPDMSVFGTAHAFSAWAGPSPGYHVKAGKRRHSATGKASRNLRATLVEVTHAVASQGVNSEPSGFRLGPWATCRCHSSAMPKATARKIARTLFVLLCDRVPCRDPGTGNEALMVNRNAAGCLRQLGRCGTLVPCIPGAACA